MVLRDGRLLQVAMVANLCDPVTWMSMHNLTVIASSKAVMLRRTSRAPPFSIISPLGVVRVSRGSSAVQIPSTGAILRRSMPRRINRIAAGPRCMFRPYAARLSSKSSSPLSRKSRTSARLGARADARSISGIGMTYPTHACGCALEGKSTAREPLTSARAGLSGYQNSHLHFRWRAGIVSSMSPRWRVV